MNVVLKKKIYKFIKLITVLETKGKNREHPNI